MNNYRLFFVIILSSLIISWSGKEEISLKEKFTENLYVLVDKLISIQNHDSVCDHFGAIYCQACSNFHSRAAEAVLPFAVAYKESGKKTYLNSAISAGDWLIKQQLADGSWVETPSDWTGTTTDQLLMLSSAFQIIEKKLSPEQALIWKSSIKKAADWIVKNMNHEFASINYCATSTATLMCAFNVTHDSSYVEKAKTLARLVISKFDEDYLLAGEGNRVRGTKYGIDFGYNLDMSLWGLGLYAKLSGDKLVDDYVKKSLERMVYFIYPDGSTDGSWGVRSSKWTTYGSFTADGSQILFSLYSKSNPVYRTAALANMNYFMNLRAEGLITYGPHYTEMFDRPPCIYPTFCRAKNLAMAILFGEQDKGDIPDLPTQKIGWAKYFNTLDVVLVRTKNFMATITGYRYKDIRRGAEFKYMFRPSGGSITNLWVKDYGYLQASGQTEYHPWEMNYPQIDSAVSITPRIEFTDAGTYCTNLYEFDSHMELHEKNGVFTVQTTGELKDKNRWEGGVAYILTHKISDDSIEKKIKLRFHGLRPTIKIIEPIVQNKNMFIKKIDDFTVEISDKGHEFIFELMDRNLSLEIGTDKEKYGQPFPSLKGYPIIIKVNPNKNNFFEEISYRIKIKK
jgi:hypothetical protein